MTDTDRMLVWLRETMDTAERDAEAAANDLWWVGQHDRIDVYNEEGVLIAGADDGVRAALDLGSPAAVLRRIDRDRKTLAECEKVLAVDGWEYDDAPELAETVVRNLAEGWGWTEEEQR